MERDLSEPKKGPTVDLSLAWERDLLFRGRAGKHELPLDGNGREGVSPVQALAFALASCMASDVVLVLTRGRQPLEGLTGHLHARRAAEDPRRLLRVEIRFEVRGAVPADKVQRAIDLSRDKYCSVWHSLRPDIELVVTPVTSPPRRS
jgi:putative redox protein